MRERDPLIRKNSALAGQSHASISSFMGISQLRGGPAHQFSQGLPYSGYHPNAPCLSCGGVYTVGSTLASGAVCAVSSGLQHCSFRRGYS